MKLSDTMLQCVVILEVLCYVKQARLQKHILYDFTYMIYLEWWILLIWCP